MGWEGDQMIAGFSSVPLVWIGSRAHQWRTQRKGQIRQKNGNEHCARVSADDASSITMVPLGSGWFASWHQGSINPEHDQFKNPLKK